MQENWKQYEGCHFICAAVLHFIYWFTVIIAGM